MSFLIRRRNSEKGSSRGEKKAPGVLKQLRVYKTLERRPSLPIGLSHPTEEGRGGTWLLDDSTHSAKSRISVRSHAALGRTTSSSLARTSSLLQPSTTRRKKQNVKWANVQVRDYERVIGDNPSCTKGVPLSIGWYYYVGLTLSVQEYEETRPPRRNAHEMLMTCEERQSVMMDEWGSTHKDVVNAIRANQRIKNRRRTTANNVGTLATKMEEVAERVKRTTKKVVLQQPSVRQKAMALVKESEMAQEQWAEIEASSCGGRSSCSGRSGSDQDTLSITESMAAAMAVAWEDPPNDEPEAASQASSSLMVSENSAKASTRRAHIEEDRTDKPVVPRRNDAYAVRTETKDDDEKDEDDDDDKPVEGHVAPRLIIATDASGSEATEKYDDYVVKEAARYDDFVVAKEPNPVEFVSSNHDPQEPEVHMLQMNTEQAFGEADGYEVDIMADDDISVISELSGHSAKSIADKVALERRHQLVNEANQRYREQKKIDERIKELDRKLAEVREAEEAKKKSRKKRFFSIPRSPSQSSKSSSKESSPPPKAPTPKTPTRKTPTPKTPTPKTPTRSSPRTATVDYTPATLVTPSPKTPVENPYLIAFDDRTEFSC